MDIFYESETPLSIYDSALDSYWFSINRYYSVMFPHREMGLHAHPEIEIMYVTDGKCTVGFAEGKVALRAGDFIFIDSLVPHNLVVDPSSPCRVLNLEPVLNRPGCFMRLDVLTKENTFRGFRKGSPAAFLCKDDDGSVHNSIQSLLYLLRRDAESMQIDFLLSLILLEIGRQYMDSRKKQPLGMTAYVKRALGFIADNFDQDISIDSVAEAVGISKAHLQRSFRQSEGCTIVEMINRLRLNKARMLLETSNIPIVEVANEVGFCSRQYFTELFTRTVGLSPASYRKRGGGNLVEGHGFMGVEVTIEN